MKRRVFLLTVHVLVFAGSLAAQGLSVKSAELSISVGGTNSSNKPFTIGAPQASTPITGVMRLNSGLIYEARLNFYTSRRRI